MEELADCIASIPESDKQNYYINHPDQEKIVAIKAKFEDCPMKFCSTASFFRDIGIRQ